jgi:hypothetical protein
MNPFSDKANPTELQTSEQLRCGDYVKTVPILICATPLKELTSAYGFYGWYDGS